MRLESLTNFEGQTVCLESFPCDEVFLMLYSILPLPFKIGFLLGRVQVLFCSPSTFRVMYSVLTLCLYKIRLS